MLSQRAEVARATYDPFGRRIEKSSAAGIVNYLYDAANTVTEVDAAGNTLGACLSNHVIGVDPA
jgi:YD repeat-containing protein